MIDDEVGQPATERLTGLSGRTSEVTSNGKSSVSKKATNTVCAAALITRDPRHGPPGIL
jgi:hypothetical protein